MFALNIVVANLLGKESFGQYSMVYSTLLAFSFIAQVATGFTATKYVAEFRISDPERAGRILGLCSLVSLLTAFIATALLVFAAPTLAGSFLKAPGLSSAFVFGAGYVFFSAINGYQEGALAGLEGYRTLGRAGALLGITHLTLASWAAWLWGLEGAFAGIVVSSSIRWLSFHLLLKKEGRLKGVQLSYRGLKTERPLLFKFALPAALPAFTTMPAIWLANAVLARTEDGYAQLALFSAAMNAKTLVVFLPSILNRVSMSLLNNQKGQGDMLRYQRLYWTNLKLVFLFAVGGAVVVAVCGQALLSLYGSQFLIGYPVLLTMVVSAILESTALAVYQVISARERMWLSFFVYALPRDVSLILLAYLLAPVYGALGLASAYACAWLLVLLTVSLAVSNIGINIVPAATRDSGQ